MAGGLEGFGALVTGGGSGIGLATATRFALDGAQVTICGRTEEKLIDAVAAIDRAAIDRAAIDRAVAEPGASPTAPAARYVVADVTVEAEIAAAVADAAAPTGRLDILFACAGGSHHLGPMVDADVAAVRATVDLNLIGSFLSLKHAAAAMQPTGGGSIVLMSSGAGHFPHRLLWAYGMAKAGIESLCAYAAEELGEVGIRVNAVQPGIIDDELMAFITAGGPLLDDYLAQMPVSRLGTVDDVASAVRYLAGPESSWVTGECLAVDGGHHLRRGADYSLLFGDQPAG
jgi:NAD(P)-dependent dehydrogenase (short-subunit alcohol dehydrogenase family)